MFEHVGHPEVPSTSVDAAHPVPHHLHRCRRPVVFLDDDAARFSAWFRRVGVGRGDQAGSEEGEEDGGRSLGFCRDIPGLSRGFLLKLHTICERHLKAKTPPCQ